MAGWRGAFTLIELVAAVLIVGLLVTAVAVSFAGSRRVAEMTDVMEQLAQQDRLMRAYATAQDQACQLLVDLSKGKIVRLEANGRKAQAHAYELPNGFRIEQAWTLSGQRATSGQLTIPCSAHGHTLTYAMKLTNGKEQSRWMLFAGLTGERLSDEQLDEKQIESIFEAMSAADARHDAD